MTHEELTVYVIATIIIIIAIADKQITLEPENNMLLGNPISILSGMLIGSSYSLTGWGIFLLCAGLISLNIIIYQIRIRGD